MPTDNLINEDFLILVVDDDDAIRFVASDTLADAGFNIIEAKNGKQALDAFKTHKPDLVLLDLVMPEIDGFQVCEALRAQPQNETLPIMIMTGLDDEESIARAFEAGATDFIIKPLNHFILEQRTRYMLRSSRVLKTLEQREARLNNAERIAKLGSWDWNGQKNALRVSKEFNRILGFAEEHPTAISDMVGLFRSEEKDRVKTLYQQVLKDKETSFVLEHTMYPTEEHPIRVRQEAEITYLENGYVRVSGTLHDITEETSSKDQILQLAYYDTLTSLPNRTFFKTHLEYSVKQAKKNSSCCAVILLDLDLFTRINNSLGHDAGDKLLAVISQRFLEAMNNPGCVKINQAAIDPHTVSEKSDDVLARLEGDQFVVVLNNFSRLDDVIAVIQRLLKRLSTPMQYNTQSVVLTASVGVALYPVNGQDSETLVRNADAAMRFAKSQGRNNFRFYSSEIDAKSKERLSIENDLRHAIRNGDLELHYQPKINVATAEVTSAEALVRWTHPERGMISPSQFIPMAEELGLINELGDWLIEEACQKTKHWNDLGIGPIRTAINLSAIQLKTPGLVEKVRSALDKVGLIASQLEVEITEGVLLEDSHRTLRTLEGLRSLGVKVALDDFGTGYSSLSYLTRFPFTTLKIDRCFITDSVKNAQSGAIVHTIIDLCRHLNLEVVAEGVELEEELRFLMKHHCDLIQGFYFSPALDPDSFANYLRQKPWLDQLSDLD